MTRPAWAGKRRDANEPEIVQALERCGFCVWRLNDPLDLLVWPRSGGRLGLIEVKDPSKPRGDRQLTDLQERFFADSEGCPRIKAETAEEAIAFAESLRMPEAMR